MSAASRMPFNEKPTGQRSARNHSSDPLRPGPDCPSHEATGDTVRGRRGMLMSPTRSSATAPWTFSSSNGLGSHVEMAWEDPVIARFLQRLSSLRRVIFFDRRGTGASDGDQQRHSDMGGVDRRHRSRPRAAESERASILTTVDGGPIAILYAAAHPERVDSLVLCNTTARYLIAADYPIGLTPEALDVVIAFLRAHWVHPSFLSLRVQTDRKTQSAATHSPGSSVRP